MPDGGATIIVERRMTGGAELGHGSVGLSSFNPQAEVVRHGE